MPLSLESSCVSTRVSPCPRKIKNKNKKRTVACCPQRKSKGRSSKKRESLLYPCNLCTNLSTFALPLQILPVTRGATASFYKSQPSFAFDYCKQFCLKFTLGFVFILIKIRNAKQLLK